MTENRIQLFNSPQFGEIRVTTDERGEPLFCLPDVCKALDLTNPRQVKTRLNPKGVQLIDNHGVTNNDGVIISKLGNTATNYINEANLYKCIFQSRKPDAEKFQNWVCEEVLPSIRKHGLYAAAQTVEQMLADPDTAIKILLRYKEERLKRLEAEKIIEENKPKVLLAEAIEESGDDCYIGELAKMLAQNGIKIGEKRLFNYLREHGYIGQSGAKRNVANQRYVEMGLFRLVESQYSDGCRTFTSIRTFVTGKGRKYFINKFLSKENME